MLEMNGNFLWKWLEINGIFYGNDWKLMEMNGFFYGNDDGTLVSARLIVSTVSIPIHRGQDVGVTDIDCFEKDCSIGGGVGDTLVAYGSLKSPRKSPRYAKIKVNGPAIFQSMSIALKLKFKTNRNQFISVCLMNCKGERWLFVISQLEIAGFWWHVFIGPATSDWPSRSLQLWPQQDRRVRLRFWGRLCPWAHEMPWMPWLVVQYIVIV